MAYRLSYSLLEIYRESLAERDGGYFCHYCAIPLGANEKVGQGLETIDHRIPLHRGGSNNIQNLVLCCEACNKEKDTQSYESFFVSKRGIRNERKAKRGIYLGAI